MMRVAVITAYYKEPLEMLKRCYDSVMAMTRPEGVEVTQIFVADGFPNAEIEKWDNVLHAVLPNNGDFGDTPRFVGGVLASAQNFDAVMMLDADNFFEPNHLETMLYVHEKTQSCVVTATRQIVRLDGSVMRVDPECNGIDFVDTNCYFITREAFTAFMGWGFKDPEVSIIGDRYFFDLIRRTGYSRSH